MSQTNEGYKFGTFKGVFTPSILPILGVILYLRMGWVLGNVGLTTTIVIVTLSVMVSLVTALSVTSLATNMYVKGGGAYYMLSRSLGVEAGAAVGIPLFLAQSVTISFYIAGFCESLQIFNPNLNVHIVGLATLAILAVIILISSDLTLKAQYIVMALIVISLISLFAGGSPELSAPAEIPVKQGFWPVLAVFFPAVTGMLVGISMSGDLKKPARSIPVGVISSLAVSYVIYLGVAFYLDYRVEDSGILMTDLLIMQKLSRFGVLILLGLWAVSLSSAMGKMLSSPRTLQALALDRVLPAWMARTAGKNKEPRIAAGIVLTISALGIIFGTLDVIAPILTMFYLTTYGLLNLATGMEELMGNPSWRPTFRMPALVSLLGAAACFGMMFMINAGATFAALTFVALVFWLMERRAMRARWGDMRLGLLMMLIRKSLMQLSRHTTVGHNWRPNLLVLAGAPQRRWHLIRLAGAISSNRSLVTIASIIPEENWSADREASLRDSILAYLGRHYIEAEVRIQPGADHWAGSRELLRTYGYGPLTPNTIIMGAPDNTDTPAAFADFVKLTLKHQRNLLVVKEAADAPDENPRRANYGTIDIWWRGRSRNASFMLAVAGMIKRNQGSGTKLRLCQIIDNPTQRESAEKVLFEFVSRARVEATIHLVPTDGGHPLEKIVDESREASMVFIGLRTPRPDESAREFGEYYSTLMGHVRRLPLTVLAMAEETVDFQSIYNVH